MNKETIAKTMCDVLTEAGETIVSRDSVSAMDECIRRCNLNESDSEIATKHPLRTINKVLEALEDSDLFTSGFIKSSTGFTRAYKLK